MSHTWSFSRSKTYGARTTAKPPLPITLARAFVPEPSRSISDITSHETTEKAGTWATTEKPKSSWETSRLSLSLLLFDAVQFSNYGGKNTAIFLRLACWMKWSTRPASATHTPGTNMGHRPKHNTTCCPTKKHDMCRQTEACRASSSVLACCRRGVS